MQILFYQGPEDGYDDQERKGDSGGKPAPLSSYTVANTSTDMGQKDYKDQAGDNRRHSDSPCCSGFVRDRHSARVWGITGIYDPITV